MRSISADLAHDIGHDLATVSCLLAVVRRATTLEPDHRRRLELVEREVIRVQTLVGMGCGTGTESVALRDVVAEVVEPVAMSTATELIVDPVADVRLTVDADSLWRLVANLVGNAVRAAGPDGRVQVGIRRGAHGEPEPCIEVTDDGPGLGSGPPGAAGLGLPTSRELAARCGAELELTSPPSGGTVACIRFTDPAHGTAPTAPARRYTREEARR